MRIVLLVLMLGLAFVDSASACEHCLGTGRANGPTIQALFLSMASLLSVIGFVGVGIGVFFFNVHRRTRQLKPGDMAVNEYGDLVAGPN